MRAQKSSFKLAPRHVAFARRLNLSRSAVDCDKERRLFNKLRPRWDMTVVRFTQGATYNFRGRSGCAERPVVVDARARERFINTDRKQRKSVNDDALIIGRRFRRYLSRTSDEAVSASSDYAVSFLFRWTRVATRSFVLSASPAIRIRIAGDKWEKCSTGSIPARITTKVEKRSNTLSSPIASQ